MNQNSAETLEEYIADLKGLSEEEKGRLKEEMGMTAEEVIKILESGSGDEAARLIESVAERGAHNLYTEVLNHHRDKAEETKVLRDMLSAAQAYAVEHGLVTAMAQLNAPPDEFAWTFDTGVNGHTLWTLIAVRSLIDGIAQASGMTATKILMDLAEMPPTPTHDCRTCSRADECELETKDQCGA